MAEKREKLRGHSRSALKISRGKRCVIRHKKKKRSTLVSRSRKRPERNPASGIAFDRQPTINLPSSRELDERESPLSCFFLLRRLLSAFLLHSAVSPLLPSSIRGSPSPRIPSYTRVSSSNAFPANSCSTRARFIDIPLANNEHSRSSYLLGANAPAPSPPSLPLPWERGNIRDESIDRN